MLNAMFTRRPEALTSPRFRLLSSSLSTQRKMALEHTDMPRCIAFGRRMIGDRQP